MNAPISSHDRWFKGALHCHTTESDGIFTPEDVLKFYMKNGYDFVALTDHDTVTRPGIEHSNILAIAGEELSVGTSRIGGNYHIIALGINDALPKGDHPTSDAVQETVEAVVERGGLAFIAHPYWSGLIADDILRVKRHSGIEIFNTGCEVEVGKGLSTAHWDQALSLGTMMNGIAVDDAHRYAYPPVDALGGWVWVKAVDLSIKSITDAMGVGLFYSSMGPKIFSLELERTLKVKCSGAKQVSIISLNGRGMVLEYLMLESIIKNWGTDRREKLKGLINDILVEKTDDAIKAEIILKNGGSLRVVTTNGAITEMECGIEPFSQYVRVEVIDQENRKAWTNPLPLK